MSIILRLLVLKHEAGEFINRNIQRFQSELKGQYFDNLRKPKNIKFILSPTENAQARFARMD